MYAAAPSVLVREAQGAVRAWIAEAAARPEAPVGSMQLWGGLTTRIGRHMGADRLPAHLAFAAAAGAALLLADSPADGLLPLLPLCLLGAVVQDMPLATRRRLETFLHPNWDGPRFGLEDGQAAALSSFLQDRMLPMCE